MSNSQNTKTWPPLPPEATAMMTDAIKAHEQAVDAVMQVSRDALARANDELRQRLQVIALGGPSDESEASR